MLVTRVTERSRFEPRTKEMQESCMSNGLLSLILEPNVKIRLFWTYMREGRDKAEKQNKTKCRHDVKKHDSTWARLLFELFPLPFKLQVIYKTWITYFKWNILLSPKHIFCVLSHFPTFSAKSSCPNTIVVSPNPHFKANLLSTKRKGNKSTCRRQENAKWTGRQLKWGVHNSSQIQQLLYLLY